MKAEETFFLVMLMISAHNVCKIRDEARVSDTRGKRLSHHSFNKTASSALDVDGDDGEDGDFEQESG